MRAFRWAATTLGERTLRGDEFASEMASGTWTELDLAERIAASYFRKFQEHARAEDTDAGQKEPPERSGEMRGGHDSGVSAEETGATSPVREPSPSSPSPAPPKSPPSVLASPRRNVYSYSVHEYHARSAAGVQAD